MKEWGHILSEEERKELAASIGENPLTPTDFKYMFDHMVINLNDVITNQKEKWYVLYRSTNHQLQGFELKFGRSYVSGKSVTIERSLKLVKGEDGIHWTFTDANGLGFTVKPISCKSCTIKILTGPDSSRIVNGIRIKTEKSEHLLYELS